MPDTKTDKVQGCLPAPCLLMHFENFSLHTVSQIRSCFEFSHFFSLNFDGLLGGWIYPFTGGTFCNGKCSKTHQSHFVTTGKCVAYVPDGGIKGFLEATFVKPEVSAIALINSPLFIIVNFKFKMLRNKYFSHANIINTFTKTNFLFRKMYFFAKDVQYPVQQHVFEVFFVILQLISKLMSVFSVLCFL